MKSRLVQWLIGIAGSAVLLSIVAWAAYRSYGPGEFSERVDRFERRWRPFISGFGSATGVDIWRFIGQGLLITLEVAAISILLSLVFGTGLALLRLTRNRQLGFPAGRAVQLALSTPATAIIQAVRASPLFLLILYTYLAAPRLGVRLTPVRAGIFALTLYTSCILAEIIRAGILSLDKGQFEAADALGLNYLKKLRFVILPQALRRMVPSVVSQLVTLIKDTSLLAFITVIELYRRVYILQQGAFNPIESFIVVGAIYFVINFALSTVARRLEVRPSRVGGAAAAAVQGLGVEDQTLVVTEAAAASGKNQAAPARS
jgi:putative glutamine transport system permease protein